MSPRKYGKAPQTRPVQISQAAYVFLDNLCESSERFFYQVVDSILEERVQKESEIKRLREELNGGSQ